MIITDSTDRWQECNFQCIELTRIHRQSDGHFITLLQKLRVGLSLSDQEEKILRNHPIDFDPEAAVKIHPRRVTVDEVNSSKLSQLPDPQQLYHWLDDYAWNQEEHPDLEYRFRRTIEGDHTAPFIEYNQDRHRYAEELALKKGMPVILLYNLDLGAGLVNGSRGHVIGFEPINVDDLPTLSGDYKRYREGTICDFSMRQGIRIAGWPIVKFENGLVRTVHAHCAVTELGPKPPHSLMSRTQLPLIAGWAITVHKSQGMTLEKAVVDVSRSWELAQTYVAMSRVKTLSGLLVRGIPPGGAMKADPVVTEFMRSFSASPNLGLMASAMGEDGQIDRNMDWRDCAPVIFRWSMRYCRFCRMVFFVQTSPSSCQPRAAAAEGRNGALVLYYFLCPCVVSLSPNIC